MVYTHENIQFSESVVKYNLINFLNLLIDMGSLSGAGKLFHNIGPLNLIDRFPNVTLCCRRFTRADHRCSLHGSSNVT